MKTIRSRLLAVLLPPLLGLALILGILIYSHQSSELEVVIWFGALSFLWLIGSVWFIAANITDPIQKLKDSALNLASGDYEEPIKSEGPQEIKELAITLNTMRECLLENISRLTDYPLQREKLYGEYECAELLQYEMVNHALEAFSEGSFSGRALTLSTSPKYGLRVLCHGDALTLQEAEEEGFRGIYKLLTEGTRKVAKIDLNTGKSTSENLPEPLIWSLKEEKLLPFQKPEVGDFVILYNTGLTRQMPHPSILKDWLAKILKHFAKDGLELTSAMMESELSFFAKKYVHHEDITILLITRPPQ